MDNQTPKPGSPPGLLSQLLGQKANIGDEAASQVLRKRMSSAGIEAEIDRLTLQLSNRFEASVEQGDTYTLNNPAPIEMASPDERWLLHVLKLALPSSTQQQQVARQRVVARLHARRLAAQGKQVPAV